MWRGTRGYGSWRARLPASNDGRRVHASGSVLLRLQQQQRASPSLASSSGWNRCFGSRNSRFDFAKMSVCGSQSYFAGQGSVRVASTLQQYDEAEDDHGAGDALDDSRISPMLAGKATSVLLADAESLIEEYDETDEVGANSEALGEDLESQEAVESEATDDSADESDEADLKELEELRLADWPEFRSALEAEVAMASEKGPEHAIDPAGLGDTDGDASVGDTLDPAPEVLDSLMKGLSVNKVRGIVARLQRYATSSKTTLERLRNSLEAYLGPVAGPWAMPLLEAQIGVGPKPNAETHADHLTAMRRANEAAAKEAGLPKILMRIRRLMPVFMHGLATVRRLPGPMTRYSPEEAREARGLTKLLAAEYDPVGLAELTAWLAGHVDTSRPMRRAAMVHFMRRRHCRHQPAAAMALLEFMGVADITEDLQLKIAEDMAARASLRKFLRIWLRAARHRSFVATLEISAPFSLEELERLRQPQAFIDAETKAANLLAHTLPAPPRKPRQLSKRPGYGLISFDVTQQCHLPGDDQNGSGGGGGGGSSSSGSRGQKVEGAVAAAGTNTAAEENVGAVTSVFAADSASDRASVGRASNASSEAASSSGFSASSSPELPESLRGMDMRGERTVFVDNLPLDVSEEEVIKAFHRCGVVERVDLYNRGIENPSRTGKNANFGFMRSWVKPLDDVLNERLSKSITHGLVTFATPDGYGRALHESMRVFGIHIREHNCKTRPACNRHIIFVGNPGLSQGAVLEEEIGAAMAPEFQVMLRYSEDEKRSPERVKLDMGSHFAARYAEAKLLQAGKAVDWLNRYHKRLAKFDIDRPDSDYTPPEPPSVELADIQAAMNANMEEPEVGRDMHKLNADISLELGPYKKPKRKRKSRAGVAAAQADGALEGAPVVPKKRGRPKKVRPEEVVPSDTAEAAAK